MSPSPFAAWSVAHRVPSWCRYAVAGFSFAMSLAITLLIRRWSGGNEPFYPLFTAGVIVAAWYGGLGPGLVAGALSVVTNADMVAAGGSHLMLPHTAELVRLAAFSLVVVFVSILANARNRALAGIREQAEALERERSLLNTMTQATDVMLVYLDRDFNFLSVNTAYAQTCRMQPEDMIGRNHFALYPNVENEAIFRRVRDTGVPVFHKDRPFEFPDQPERGVTYWDWSLVPVKQGNGAISGLVFSLRETTAHKRAEESLRQERASAEEALREADRRKDEFLAVLSHELRNPLAPIRYALPLLQRERLTDAAGRAVGVINRQVDLLARLVDDLLDVSRITRGKIELRCEHVTLESILTAAAEAASPAIVAGRHRLQMVVPDDPVWLYADPARLAQVVTNLLNNSAKYTPRGGEITLETRRDDGHAIVRVRDTGIGIPEEALPTLFEMFRQVNHPDTSQGGLGIGLALSKQLVEMHGGSIEAQSAGIGHGAEFVVRLPVAKDAKVDEAPPPTSGIAPPTGRRLKVLIVDDNADLVEMLAAGVSALGHDVRKALDGRSALSAAISYRPDVVLLDLGLPVMGGIEVARQLRRRPETATARLVALTGWGQAEDRRQTEEAGFDRHLTKPTDPKTLERLLAEFASAKTS